jgi:hypothetical protein
MQVREIAYTNRFLGDCQPLNITENQEAVLTYLLQIAECTEIENEVEELHKGVYQDNYYMERYGVQYVIQHDIVCDYLVLYEVIGG